jgi:hypothetical protein
MEGEEMTRIVEMRSVALGLAVSFALAGPVAWSSHALAQGTAPAASQPGAQGDQMVEGKIAKVSGAKLTLADGTVLMIPSDVKVQRADLKPGATVKASFEEHGGQKVVTAIAVEPTK